MPPCVTRLLRVSFCRSHLASADEYSASFPLSFDVLALEEVIVESCHLVQNTLLVYRETDCYLETGSVTEVPLHEKVSHHDYDHIHLENAHIMRSFICPKHRLLTFSLRMYGGIPVSIIVWQSSGARLNPIPSVGVSIPLYSLAQPGRRVLST